MSLMKMSLLSGKVPKNAASSPIRMPKTSPPNNGIKRGGFLPSPLMPVLGQRRKKHT
jgi:hypothetical protein